MVKKKKVKVWKVRFTVTMLAESKKDAIKKGKKLVGIGSGIAYAKKSRRHL